MENYDSILKEKKKYVEEPSIKKNSYNKYVVIELFVVIIALIISYFFYYHNILTSKNIFLYNSNYLINEIKPVFSPLNLDSILDLTSYSLEGNLVFDEYKYDYELIREQEKTKFLLKNSEQSLIYYFDNLNLYTKISSFKDDNYIEQSNYNWFDIIRDLKIIFDEKIDEKLFIKRFYFEEKTPIVEVNIELDNELINKLFASTIINDDVEYILTFKNNALTEEMISGKLIVNNKTKNTRDVFVYKNKTLSLTNNNGNITKYSLNSKKNDFTLKISNNDNLYSILIGSQKEDSYQYSYQIIDTIYGINLNINKNADIITYNIHSNYEDNNHTIEKDLVATCLVRETGALDEEVENKINFSSLSDDEKNNFKNSINDFMLPIRNFIYQHKNSIN